MTSWVPFVFWAVLGYVLAVEVLVTGPQRDPAAFILVAIVFGFGGGLITSKILRVRESGRRKERLRREGLIK